MATTIQFPIPHISESAAFLNLWPHRFDFLYARHPDVGAKPNWQTERKFPLNDRTLSQGEQLYGVRFGKTTDYVMIDVDRHSAYHPDRGLEKIRRIRHAMESIGLVESVVCTSSDSEGLHLYFPLDKAQKSWAIGIAVTALMERQGLKVKPGQLEVFPNARPYCRTGLPTLFNGHRLPMQNGSELVNAEFERIWSDRDTFVKHWERAKQRNQLDQAAVDRLVKTRKQKFAVTTSAEKFLNDLNADIQEGWTDSGQTNFILGRIAMRSYIFGHVLYAGESLEGDTLIEDIVKVAKALPGYGEWCGHQPDLEKRAKEWARCVETSKYFHYGRKEIAIAETAPEPNGRDRWNESQKQAARERIRTAIADLLEKGTLAIGKTDRFNQLIQYKISGSTLYKHRDLWEPSISPEKNLEKPRNLLIADERNNAAELTPSDQGLRANEPEGQSQGQQEKIEGWNDSARLMDWVTRSEERAANEGAIGSVDKTDLSELLVEIQIMQMRLDWSREDLAIYVAENFGGRRRGQLGVEELVELCDRLEGLVARFEGVP